MHVPSLSQGTMGRVAGAVAAVAATAILISITIIVNNRQIGPPTGVRVDSTEHVGTWAAAQVPPQAQEISSMEVSTAHSQLLRSNLWGAEISQPMIPAGLEPR